MRSSGGGFRRLSLVLVLIVFFLGVAAAQDQGNSPATPLRMAVTETVGFEAETGRPGALVAREQLGLEKARLSMSVDLASALGVLPETDSSLVDSAGLQTSYRFGALRRTQLSLTGFLRYRFLVEGAWDLRFGTTLDGNWGAGAQQRGLFGDWALGFEEVRTALQAFPEALWQGDPLMRVALGWRFNPLWSVQAVVESFSDEDATYFLRTLFEYGATLDLGSFAMRGRVMLKYSDFFTPTGYLDGLAIRLSARLPLGGRP